MATAKGWMARCQDAAVCVIGTQHFGHAENSHGLQRRIECCAQAHDMTCAVWKTRVHLASVMCVVRVVRMVRGSK